MIAMSVAESPSSGMGVLDSTYHMTLTLLKNRTFDVKTSRFCGLLHKV